MAVPSPVAANKMEEKEVAEKVIRKVAEKVKVEKEVAKAKATVFVMLFEILGVATEGTPVTLGMKVVVAGDVAGVAALVAVVVVAWACRLQDMDSYLQDTVIHLWDMALLRLGMAIRLLDTVIRLHMVIHRQDMVIHHQDMGTHLGSLLKDRDGNLGSRSLRHLLQADRGRQARWAGADDDHVVFHRLTFEGLAHFATSGTPVATRPALFP